MSARREWWRGAVIYEVYPRSFMDASGDGVGDLRGLTERVDYIASLGVDAVWVAPFFHSPMQDFGYDVSDYRQVDPRFGDMADFDALLDAAHRAGLKVLIDHVASHSSDRHPWFLDSRESASAPKADWYVWADARADGSAPNNWLSVFGGVAWRWEPRRGQYCLHNFLPSQPDLNFHNPAVRRAVLDNMAFWLDRGVDGFRMDAVNFCHHDPQLRDNPPAPRAADAEFVGADDSPYARQRHRYSQSRPENLGFLRELRALLARYPDAVSLGEIGADEEVSAAMIAEYTQGDERLHMAYSFALLTKAFSARHIRGVIERQEACLGDGWACWALGNHDVERVLSRWGDGADARLAALLNGLVCCLRGSVCCYQGEELGLPEAELAFEDLRDPVGINFWPRYKGRDGCRTPMPWRADAVHGGFSTQRPWLPMESRHLALAVSAQEGEPDSTLTRYRELLRARRRLPALRYGDIRFVDAPEPLLCFLRECDGQRVLAAFNLSADTVHWTAPEGWRLSPLPDFGMRAAKRDGAQLVFDAYAACIAERLDA